MNKITAILIGALLFVLLIQAVQLIPLTKAHQNSDDGNERHMGMNHMRCMMGMNFEEMDADGDGKCDMCGMPISECEEMMEDHEDMEEMMIGHHGMMEQHMGCQM